MPLTSIANLLFGVVPALVVLAACSGAGDPDTEEETMNDSSVELASPAFIDGSDIPTKYTCDGEDVSPPLEWSNLPEGTKSIALIVDDPDAPGRTFVHWVLYAISPDARGLPENVGACRCFGGVNTEYCSVPVGGSSCSPMDSKSITPLTVRLLFDPTIILYSSSPGTISLTSSLLCSKE